MINKNYIYFDWLLEWDLAGNGGRIKDTYKSQTKESMLAELASKEAWRSPKLYKLEEVINEQA